MTDDGLEKSFNEELGGEIVNIYVGSKREKFCVHRRLLCEQSPYFDKALSNSREVYPGLFRYELNVDIRAFSMVVTWLYKGTISPPVARLPVTSARVFISRNIELYILADKLEIYSLVDAAMNSMGSCYSFFGLYPLNSEIDQVYSKIKKEDPLRDYMTQAFYFMLLSNAKTEHHETPHVTTVELWEIAKTHDELGKELFQNLRKGTKEAKNPHELFNCDYHRHHQNIRCLSRGKRFNGSIEPKIDNTRPINSPILKPFLLPHAPAPKPKNPDSQATAALVTLVATGSNTAPLEPLKQHDKRGDPRTDNGECRSETLDELFNNTNWHNHINTLTERKPPSPKTPGPQTITPDRHPGYLGTVSGSADILGTYPVSDKRARSGSDGRDEDSLRGNKRGRRGGGGRPVHR